MARATLRRKLPRQVFIKAAHLLKTGEAKSRDQAIAIAASYYRRGRLSKTGHLTR